jgi:hypothetical protein
MAAVLTTVERQLGRDHGEILVFINASAHGLR